MEGSRASLSPVMDTVQPGDKLVGVRVHSAHPLPGSCWRASVRPGVTACISACDRKTLGSPEGPKATVPCTVWQCSTARSAATR